VIDCSEGFAQFVFLIRLHCLNLSLLQGIKVLIEIGVDLNFGDMKQRPICLATESENVETVKTLLHYGISNDSIKAALVISLDKNLDVITGLLLEHIAVDRSRDVVSFRGLELLTLKPLWVLPSLGYTMTKGRGHKRVRSLGPLKENILHLKNAAAEALPGSSEPQPSNRRQSIDATALKYLNLPKDSSGQEPIEETDFGGGPNALKVKAPEPGLKENFEDSFMSGSDVFVTSGDMPGSPASFERSVMSNSLIMPKGSFRRPAEGPITGAHYILQGMLDQYVMEDVDGGNYFSIPNQHNNSTSPAQLCKQLRRYQKKRKHSTVLESGQYFPRLDPKLSTSSAQKLYESISDSSVSDNSYNISSSVTPSLTRGESKSADSSPVVPLSSDNKKKLKRKLTEGNLPAYMASDSGSEAALGGVSSEHKEFSGPSHSSSHFIKVLDLSSNQFKDFADLENLQYGGGFLFRHLKDVRKLDAKQNAITKLPEDLLKVRNSVNSAQSLVSISV